MPFWNSNKLRSQGESIFDHFDTDLVKSGAYEMRPRSEALISGVDGVKSCDKDEDIIKIKPGQFAILMTREKISVPLEVLGLISIKYTHKAKGLVNVSGFHVDPGFSGHLKFSVFNASPKALYIDSREPFFQIWFCDMTGEIESYSGAHGSQNRFTPKEVELTDEEFPSPPLLKEQINDLSKEVVRLRILLVSIGMAVLVALFKGAIFGS